MANLFKWVNFKVPDRKKKRGLRMEKKVITSADVQFSAQNRVKSKKKVITFAGKVFQTTSGSLKCTSGSLSDLRVSGSPSLA